MKFAYELTAEDKAEYLDHIRDGLNPQEAAEQCDSTGTQFKRHWNNPDSQYYDPAFAQAFKDAYFGEAHAAGRLDEIRGMQWKKAREGDSRMIEKLSLVYDPAWKELRHQNLNVNVEMIARMMPGFTLEQVEAAYAEYQEMRAAKTPRLLTAGEAA